MALSHHDSPDHRPDPAERGPIACPKCRRKAELVQVGGVTIDRCTACGGLWLDALELERVLATRGAARKADPKAPEIEAATGRSGASICPRDGSMLIHMVDQRQTHIRYESCTVCGGVFLDAGELRDLSEFTLGERLRSIFS